MPNEGSDVTKQTPPSVKIFLALALCLTVVGTSIAQQDSQNSSPPGVSILNVKWSRKLTPPGRFEPPSFDASRSTPPQQPRPTVPVASSPFPPGGRLPYYYAYSITVKNDGPKGIKALAWEHVFADPESGRELGRHNFASYNRKSGGGGVTFTTESASAPSKVVTAEGLAARGERAPYAERVQIRCVLYKDGTTWEHPGAPGVGCDWLERREAFRRQRRRR